MRSNSMNLLQRYHLKVTTLEMEMNCLKQMADIICFRIRQLMLLLYFAVV